MSDLNSFIPHAFRPDITGATLDEKHQTHFFLQQKPTQQQKLHAICFGPKKDNVLINLEHAITSEDNILVLYYEDIHKRWTYVKTHQTQYFLYQKNAHDTLILHPECLYIRGCTITAHTPAWQTIGLFYAFTNTWPHRILCAPHSQCANESKLYQLNHSLRTAAKKTPAISIGKSYVIKGPGLYQQKIENKPCIVKSLSGIRSIVVNQEAFMHWDRTQIHHLPVLFQSTVQGQDLRVHLIQNQPFAQLSLAKDSIDYRYDKHFFTLKTLHNLPKALVKFTQTVSHIENNQLIGLDFIQTDTHYVVLEANPSPGWSAYHECHGIEIPPFIQALIQTLKSHNFEARS